MAKIWRDEKGKLFHDECFEEGESRDNYVAVTLDEIDEDSECESCGGEFLVGPELDEEDDEEPGVEEP